MCVELLPVPLVKLGGHKILCVQKFDNDGQQNVRSRDGQFNRVVYHWTDVHRRFQYELLYQWDNVVRVEPPRRQVALTV